MSVERSRLSSDAKDALARDIPADAAVRAALRGALLRYGTIDLDGDAVFRTRRPAVARLARVLFDGDHRGSPVRRGQDARLYRATTFDIVLGPAARSGSSIAAKSRAQRRAELRGAFLCVGSLAAPHRGYHLEFATTADAAERIEDLLRAEGVTASRMQRKGRTVVYLKALDAIVTVLGAIGASSAILHLEDVRAMKETKNRIHRLVNTEAANVVRATTAAATACDAIAYLADAYGLRNLSPVLREAATLRLAHPDETLSELGRRCVPQVGKATLNGRIAALLRLVKRLRRSREEPEVSSA